MTYTTKQLREAFNEAPHDLRVELVRRIKSQSKELGLTNDEITDFLLLAGTLLVCNYGHKDGYSILEPGQYLLQKDFDIAELLREVEGNTKTSRQNLSVLHDVQDYFSRAQKHLSDAYHSLILHIQRLDVDIDYSRILIRDVLDYFLYSDGKMAVPSIHPYFQKLIVDLAEIQAGDSVFDMHASAGGIITESIDRINNERIDIQAIELNRRSYLIASVRVMLSNYPQAHIEQGNCFDVGSSIYSQTRFDSIISVLPLNHRLSDSDRHRFFNFEHHTSDYTGLYIQQAMHQLNKNGRAVLLVSRGFLSSLRQSDVRFREWLLETFLVEMIVGLPAGALVNTPSTSALIVISNAQPLFPIKMRSYLDGGSAPKVPKDPEDFFSLIESDSEKAERILSEFDEWEIEPEDIDEKVNLSPVNRSDLALLENLKDLTESNPDIVTMKISECCDLISGVNIRSEDLVEDGGVNSIGYLRISDIQNFRTKTSVKFLSNEGASFPKEKRLESNDVVISRSGTVGKVGFVTKGSYGSLCSTGLYIIRPRNRYLSSSYLTAYLNSDSVQEWLQAYTRGGTIRHLDRASLENIEIPIPNIAQQKKLFGDAGDDLIINIPPDEFWPLVLGGGFKKSLVSHEIDNALKLISGVEDSESFGDIIEALKSVVSSLIPAREIIEGQISESYLSSSDENQWFISLFEVFDKCFGESFDKLNVSSSAFSIFYTLKEFPAEVVSISSDFVDSQKFNSTYDDFITLLIRLSSKARDLVYLKGGVKLEVIEKDAIGNLVVKVSNNSEFPLYSFGLFVNCPDSGGNDIGWEMEVGTIPGKQSVTVPIEKDQELLGSIRYLKYFWHAQTIEKNDITDEGRIEIPSILSIGAADFSGSPYICGDPIRPDNSNVFFGREELIKKIQRQIVNTGNVVLLEGNRRAGKTSILKHLEGLEVIDGWLGVYCSLQGATGSQDGYGVPTEEVFRAMVLSIARSLFVNDIECVLPNGQPCESKLGISKACREGISKENPYSDFNEYLEFVLETLEERNIRLFLMMDEFDKLQEGIDSGVTSPQVPENIRYLVQNHTGFSAILTGSRRLKRLRQEYWSALFGLGTRVGVTALSEQDSTLLVTDPVKGLIEYDQAAVKYVTGLCARQPFLIQSLCNRIYDLAARENIRSISTVQVDKAADEFVMDNEHFRSLWDYAASDIRRFLLCYLSKEDTNGISAIHSNFEGFGIDIREEKLIEDLDFLIELELVKRSSTDLYSLEVPLMISWIEEQQDFEALRIKAVNEAGDYSYG